GIADLVAYRPGNGTWDILKSSTSLAVRFQWGLIGDVPVPGDYDGDGKGDIAVFRPATGTWYVLKSSTNFTDSTSSHCALPGDIPVPSDYDADGKTDLAVYRPDSGTWFIVLSASGASVSFQWGLTTDLPTSNTSVAYGLTATRTPVSLARASDFDGDHQSD